MFHFFAFLQESVPTVTSGDNPEVENMRSPNVLRVVERTLWSSYSRMRGSTYYRALGHSAARFDKFPTWLTSTDLCFFSGLILLIVLAYTNSAISLLLSLVLIMFAVKILFSLLENTLLYGQNEPATSRIICDHPGLAGFKTWETVELQPDGHLGPLITGFLILHDSESLRPDLPTIYILHGNAGNVGHRLAFCRHLYDHIPCNILIIDYRGYGRSSGSPSEAGLYADAQAGLRYLLARSDISHEKIIVFGRSLGGAIAIHLATGSQPISAGGVRGVIVENTFVSLPEVAHDLFKSYFGALTSMIMPSFMFTNQYQSLQRLRETRQQPLAPFLFLSGGKDELLSPSMMERLALAYREKRPSTVVGGKRTDSPTMTPAQFKTSGTDGGLVRFSEGGHNDTWVQPDWVDVTSRFVQYCVSVANPPTNDCVV